MKTIKDYWNLFLIWLGIRTIEAQVISDFAKSEQLNETKERDNFNKAKTNNNSNNANKVTPTLIKKRKFKVKDKDFWFYKDEDEMEDDDIIIGYFIYDSLTNQIIQEFDGNPIAHRDFSDYTFDGYVTWEESAYLGGDFGGGGAGGNWTETKTNEYE